MADTEKAEEEEEEVEEAGGGGELGHDGEGEEACSGLGAGE